MALLRLLNGRYQTKVFHINRNINYVAQYCGTESILAIYICKTNKGVLSLNSWCFKNIRQWIIPFCDTRFFLFFGMSRMFSVSQICLLGLCATQLLFLQWMLRWLWVNGSNSREPFHCTNLCTARVWTGKESFSFLPFGKTVI